MNDLTEYLNGAIERIVRQTLKLSLSNPLESAFFLKYSHTQKAAAKKRQAADIHIPPFLIASIATQCNLKCKGCYARANGNCGSQQREELTAAQWKHIFSEAAGLGISFILLAGGEPLTRRDILGAAAGQPDIVFPVFTNGTLFDDDTFELFDKHRNLIPVFSLEGDSAQTDERRGNGVYARTTGTMNRMNARGIYYGASLTVTTQNIGTVTDSSYISSLYEQGCKLVIFVEYVPVQPETASLAPSDTERALLAARQKELKERFENMIFLSFPGDEEKLGGCLAAGRGFFHISATGSAEPCPFSPYSDCSLKDISLREALQSPLFQKLKESGLLEGGHSGGCVLYDEKEEVRKISGQTI